MQEEAKGNETTGEETARVRVMTAQERAGYEGMTIDEASDGQAYEAPGAERRRVHVSFEAQEGTLWDRVLRQLLGPHWKWKLGAVAAVLVIGVFFFFIALPVLSVLFVAAGLLWLVGRLFQG